MLDRKKLKKEQEPEKNSSNEKSIESKQDQTPQKSQDQEQATNSAQDEPMFEAVTDVNHTETVPVPNENTKPQGVKRPPPDSKSTRKRNPPAKRRRKNETQDTPVKEDIVVIAPPARPPLPHNSCLECEQPLDSVTTFPVAFAFF